MPWRGLQPLRGRGAGTLGFKAHTSSPCFELWINGGWQDMWGRYIYIYLYGEVYMEFKM